MFAHFPPPCETSVINHTLQVFIFSHTSPNLYHLPRFNLILSFSDCFALLVPTHPPLSALSFANIFIIQFHSRLSPLASPVSAAVPRTSPPPGSPLFRRHIPPQRFLISPCLSSPCPSTQYVTPLREDKGPRREDDVCVRMHGRAVLYMSLLSDKRFKKKK